MIDLSTQYLGLKLAHPLVPSSSPLTKELSSVRRLEDAGASAIILPSLFEEKIAAEQQQLERFLYTQGLGHGEADSFHPVPDQLKSYHEHYLDYLYSVKEALSIPVIASLNGITPGGWMDYALDLQDAGADALELNIYHIAANPDEDSAAVENRYLDILQLLKSRVSIPITLKLSPQFSSPINFAKRLQQAGAQGISIFNRFYQADIDLNSLQIIPKLELSTSAEALLRVRWAALFYGRINMSLAVTGGFHQTSDVIKALLAGADVVHLCSVLLLHGPEHLNTLLHELQNWLEEFEYQSIRQLQGSVSQQHAIDPSVYERANYIHVLDSYSAASGVLR